MSANIMVGVGRLAIVSLVLVNFPTQTAVAQGVDPQIQQQVDQYVVRPSGEELIIKSEPAIKKKPKTQNRRATGRRLPKRNDAK